MAGAGRPKAPLAVSDAERATLERWAGGRPARGMAARGTAAEGLALRGTAAEGLALRSKILLACAEGQANCDVAARWGVTPQTVGKWRARFVAGRLTGLADDPRSGRPRKITDEQVAKVIVKTLQEVPPGRGAHWSTRSMAEATGLSQTAISRIWRTSGLKPQVRMAWEPPGEPLSPAPIGQAVR